MVYIEHSTDVNRMQDRNCVIRLWLIDCVRRHTSTRTAMNHATVPRLAGQSAYGKWRLQPSAQCSKWNPAVSKLHKLRLRATSKCSAPLSVLVIKQHRMHGRLTFQVPSIKNMHTRKYFENVCIINRIFASNNWVQSRSPAWRRVNREFERVQTVHVGATDWSARLVC